MELTNAPKRSGCRTPPSRRNAAMTRMNVSWRRSSTLSDASVRALTLFKISNKMAFRRTIRIPQTFHIVSVKRKEFQRDPRVLDEEYIFALPRGQSIKHFMQSPETERA
jgi:hypothetical protein